MAFMRNANLKGVLLCEVVRIDSCIHGVPPLLLAVFGCSMLRFWLSFGSFGICESLGSVGTPSGAFQPVAEESALSSRGAALPAWFYWVINAIAATVFGFAGIVFARARPLWVEVGSRIRNLTSTGMHSIRRSQATSIEFEDCESDAAIPIMGVRSIAPRIPLGTNRMLKLSTATGEIRAQVSLI